MTQRWTLPNGLTCLYQESRDVPLVAGPLFLRAGSRDETDQEAGLCSFTMEMLMQGTRRKSAKTIADLVESIGGAMGIQASEDYSEADFLVPAPYFERVFDLLIEILSEPGWPADEVVKQKSHVLADLRSRHDGIFNVAFDAMRQALFKTHPYARLSDGTPQTVRAFQRKALSGWHERFIQPDRAVLSLIGSLSAAEAERIVRRHASRWSRSAIVDASRAPQRPTAPTESLAIDLKANFKQAYLMTGTLAPSMRETQTLPLKLFNIILGGGMSSRLFMDLREKMGLAYEISSFYPARRDPSVWSVYMGLPPERMAVAEEALTKLLTQIAQDGVTATEIAQAKRMMIGSFVMDHQTRRRQAWYAGWWEFVGRTQDFGAGQAERIRTIQDEEVNAAARTILAKPRLTVKVMPYNL